jgi:RNA polymerase sigma-70 factor (ECF subfamily)
MRRGAVEDFEQFYAATQQRVIRLLCAVTGDVQEAQDYAQEAYVRAAVRWSRVRVLDSPEAWVRRVGMNLAYDGRRRLLVRRASETRQRLAEHVAGPQESSLDVVRAVRRLARAQQEVVLLHYLLDLSVADVARELGRPENTVKTQLLRARAALAELLTLDDEVAAHE